MQEKIKEIERKALAHLEQLFNEGEFTGIMNIQARAEQLPNGEYVRFYEPVAEKLDKNRFGKYIKKTFFHQKKISMRILLRD